MTEETKAPEQGQTDQKDCRHHHDHDHGHGHHGQKKGRKNVNPDSLTGLMFKVGHVLHHSDEADVQDDKLFAALDAQEQAQLKSLLEKLISSWKEEASEK
jgi:hypothetical protein